MPRVKFLSSFSILLFSYTLIFAQNVTEKTFNNVSEVNVLGKFMTVTINGEDRSDVEVKTDLNDRATEHYKVDLRQSGNKLTVEVIALHQRNNLGDIRGEIHIETPKNIELDVTNSSGSVSAKNINAENFSLLASSGSLYADAIKAKNINLKTSSGGIHTSGIKGTDVDVLSSSGSQRLENIDADLQAVSSSGSINLREFKGEISLKSSSGRIEGDKITLINSGKFRSSSGSIHIELTNKQSELSFNCNSSSGGIRIGNERGGKKIILREGDIQIEAVSSSGSQNFSFVQ
ncbi:MAG: hypothetical protein CMO01_00905 [Thalassobius sp.]|nr:hypothetical protein [Thalassovita sp.]